MVENTSDEYLKEIEEINHLIKIAEDDLNKSWIETKRLLEEVNSIQNTLIARISDSKITLKSERNQKLALLEITKAELAETQAEGKFAQEKINVTSAVLEMLNLLMDQD